MRVTDLDWQNKFVFTASVTLPWLRPAFIKMYVKFGDAWFDDNIFIFNTEIEWRDLTSR